MDIVIHTGETKAESGETLVSLSFTSDKKEHAVLLLQVEASPRDAKTLEDEATAIVQHALLGTEGEGWDRLDGALKELNGLFKGLLVSRTVEDIHALIALVDPDGSLHVSHAGRAEAYLIRKGTTTQITEYTRGKPVPMFVHISSGSLEPKDTVVFSTQRLLRTITAAQLAQLAQKQHHLLQELEVRLEGEGESAALAVITTTPKNQQSLAETAPARNMPPSRRGAARRGGRGGGWAGKAQTFLASLTPVATNVGRRVGRSAVRSSSSFAKWTRNLQPMIGRLLADLKNPKRRRRAHLLLLAGAVGTFVVLWLLISLVTSGVGGSTKEELADLISKANAEIKTAENRKLSGDTDSAAALLERAEEQASKVMNDESRYFRTEALELLERIRAKREEILNIVRIQPRVLVNLSAKNSDIAALGIVGISDGELTVYDRESAYRVLLNSVSDPEKITDEDLLLDGTFFSRYKTIVFLTNGDSIEELSGNQVISMKTEDPTGWKKGKDVEAYLRFLYILSPENNQIYKYERMSNRYSTPVEFNVSGDVKGALDMAIDGSIYVLKENGLVLKLLRGETQPFSVKHGPENVLKGSTKLFKVTDKNFYFLDPENSRIIVLTDGGAAGEASYVRQYILEGEQMGTLQDLYVDPEENHLYVLDEHRVYVIDVTSK
jgi:hypothetical protein